jgi:hypothetical protein
VIYLLCPQDVFHCGARYWLYADGPKIRTAQTPPARRFSQRLGAGIVRKGDQGRKTSTAFRAVPNVTRLVIAPKLGPHRRNQFRIAVNATYQHGDLVVSPRPAIDCPPQIGKTESISRPLLVRGVNQWIGEIAKLPTLLHR